MVGITGTRSCKKDDDGDEGLHYDWPDLIDLKKTMKLEVEGFALCDLLFLSLVLLSFSSVSLENTCCKTNK